MRYRIQRTGPFSASARYCSAPFCEIITAARIGSSQYAAPRTQFASHPMTTTITMRRTTWPLSSWPVGGCTSNVAGYAMTRLLCVAPGSGSRWLSLIVLDIWRACLRPLGLLRQSLREWFTTSHSEDVMLRAIDTWVNVSMGGTGRPEYLVRVAEAYFKRG